MGTDLRTAKAGPMTATLQQPAPPARLAARGRRHDLLWFYLSIFGLTWGIAAALLVARPQVEAVFGPFSVTNPLYFLAVYAPTLTAIVLTGVREGRAGLLELARRVFRWRVSWKWYALVLLGWPAMDYLARLLQWAVTGEPVSLVLVATSPPVDGLPWYVVPSLLVSTLLLDAGPLGEEVGQRGYALPRMLARRSALVAALEIGVVWGVWHVPAFFVGGTAQHDHAMGIGWLVLGTTVSSVLMTWISLRTRGSVLVAGILVHLMNNVTVADLWAFTVVALVVAVPAAVSLHRGTATRDGAGGLS
jgi:membrane protease YdiL (CAAX protease family)